MWRILELLRIACLSAATLTLIIVILLIVAGRFP